MTVSPDGRTLFSGGEVWDLDAGKLRHRLARAAHAPATAFSADGRRLATGIYIGDMRKTGEHLEEMVFLWDVRTGRELRAFRSDATGIRDVAISPDSRLLATASQDGTLRVFDVDSGAVRFEFDAHRGGVHSVCFAGVDRLVTTGSDGFAKWWMLEGDDVRAEAKRVLGLMR